MTDSNSIYKTLNKDDLVLVQNHNEPFLNDSMPAARKPREAIKIGIKIWCK